MSRTVNALHLPCSEGNPYQLLLAGALVRLGARVELARKKPRFLVYYMWRRRQNTLHLHWIDWCYLSRTRIMSVAKLAWFALELALLRLGGVRIVWTLHNLVNHDRSQAEIDRAGMLVVSRLAHRIMVHAEAIRSEAMHALRLRDGRQLIAVPFGHYIDAYPHDVTREQARERLGMPGDAVVFLFMGAIRAYKGVSELIDAFKEAGGKDAKLVLVGAVTKPEFEAALRRQIGDDPRIHFKPGFVADSEVQVFMKACDAVVLPFRSVTTSASTILAMSFGRAVIAPRVGFVAEVLEGQGGLLYDPAAPAALRDMLREAEARRNELPAAGQRNFDRVTSWTWDAVAAATFDAYAAADGRGKS